MIINCIIFFLYLQYFSKILDNYISFLYNKIRLIYKENAQMKNLEINLKQQYLGIDSVISFIDNEPILYAIKNHSATDIFTNNSCSICKSTCTSDLNKKISLLLKNGNFKRTLVLHTPFKTNSNTIVFAKEITKDENLSISIKKGILSISTIENTNNELDILPVLSNNSITNLQISTRSANQDDFCILSFHIDSNNLQAILLRLSDDSIIAKNTIPVNKSVDNSYLKSLISKSIKNLKKSLNININIVGIGITGKKEILSKININKCNNIAHNSAYNKALLHLDSNFSSVIEITKEKSEILSLSNKVISKHIINENCHYNNYDYFKYALEEYVDIENDFIENSAISASEPLKLTVDCPYKFLKNLPNILNSKTKLNDFIASIIYLIAQNTINLCDPSLLGDKILVIDSITNNNLLATAIANLTESEIYTIENSEYLKALGCAESIKSQILEGSIKRISLTLDTVDDALNILPISNVKSDGINLVEIRNNLLFNTDIVPNADKLNKTIGLLPTSSTNLLYPLYYNFFAKLGYNVKLADLSNDNTSYSLDTCDIMKNSLNLASNLIESNVDYIFLPQLKYIPIKESGKTNKTCKFIEFEGRMIKNLFNNQKDKILTPKINFAGNILEAEKDFVNIAISLGNTLEDATNAFAFATNKYKKYLLEVENTTKESIKNILSSNKETIVIFDKLYSSKALKISNIISKYGYNVLPYDLISYTNENQEEDFFTESDRIVLKAAKTVQKNPNYYALYLKTQNCEDDIFLLNSFSNAMQKKPFLSLSNIDNDDIVEKELANYFEIIENYKDVSNIRYRFNEPYSSFLPAQTYQRDDSLYVFNSEGTRFNLTDDNVCLVIPSIGENTSKNIASAFRYIGINAVGLSSPTKEDFKIGTKYLKSKSNIPATYLLGSLLNFINKNTDIYKTFVFLMPKNIESNKTFLYINTFKNIIARNSIKNLAILTIDSTLSSISFSTDFKRRLVTSVIVSDILDDISNSLKVMAQDKSYASSKFSEYTDIIAESLENDNNKNLFATLNRIANLLSAIPVSAKLSDIPKVTILGENYSNKNETLRKDILANLANHNVIANSTPIFAFFKYSNLKNTPSSRNLISSSMLTNMQISAIETKLKKVFAKSGLYNYEKTSFSDKIKNIIKEPIVPNNEIEFDINNSPLSTDGYISIGTEMSTTNRLAKAMYPDTIINQKTNKKLPFLSINTANSNLNKLKLDNFCNRLRQ